MDKIISVEQVRALCGGKFPEANGFAWDRVDHFKLEDGLLQPYSGAYGILPGPGLEILIKECIPFA